MAPDVKQELALRPLSFDRLRTIKPSADGTFVSTTADREAANRFGIAEGRSVLPVTGSSFVAPNGSSRTTVNNPRLNNGYGIAREGAEAGLTGGSPLTRILAQIGNMDGLSEGTKQFVKNLNGENSEMSIREKAALGKGSNPTRALNELAKYIMNIKGDASAKLEYQEAIIGLANLRGVRLDDASLQTMNTALGYSAATDARDRQSYGGYGSGGFNTGGYNEPSTAGKIVNIAANVLGGLNQGMNQNRNGGSFGWGGNQQGGGWFSNMINYFKS